jgi:O-antigen/teichoic acid export membrane protein
MAAKLIGAEAIGIASAIAAFVDIISTIIIMDMSYGMKRSLGLAISAGDYGSFKHVVTATVLFVSITITTSLIILFWPSINILSMVGLDPQFAWIVIVMIPFLSFRYIFTEVLIAALKSDNLILPFLIGSISRFPIFFAILYFFEAPILGTVIGYFSMIVISSVSFVFYSIKIFKGKSPSSPSTSNFFQIIRVLLKASIVSWFPRVINVLGYQLNILTTLLIVGAKDAGVFYLSMGILVVIQFIVTGITKVTHSLVGSMKTEEEQISFLAYTTKIAYMFTMPICVPLVFFSHDYLELIGTEFSSISSVLTILMISMPMLILSEMIFYFFYGRGDHKSVLLLGLIGNIPRIILYFILPAVLGPNGTAIAWLIGSITQTSAAIWIAKQQSISLEYTKYVLLTAIPFVIGSITFFLSLYFFISTFVIIFGSFLLYVKLHYFTETDLHNVLYSTLPPLRAEKTYPIALRILRLIVR